MFNFPNKVNNEPKEPIVSNANPKFKAKEVPKNPDVAKIKVLQALWRGFHARKELAQQNELLRVQFLSKVGISIIFYF